MAFSSLKRVPAIPYCRVTLGALPVSDADHSELSEKAIQILHVESVARAMTWCQWLGFNGSVLWMFVRAKETAPVSTAHSR
jgi:hypothetical protein